MSWIKLHRKFLKWEWYSDINTKTVFLHLLITANYEENKWRGVVIKRGQVVIGIDKLATNVSLSFQQTRTALDKLKSTNEITSESTNNFTVITIVKYEEYQSADAESTNEITSNQHSNNKRITNEQQTDNKRITTLKEEQEIKEKKERETHTQNFQNLVFEGEFAEATNASKLEGDAATKSWQKFKIHFAENPPENFLTAWQKWVLNERIPPTYAGQSEGVAKPLEGRDLMIQRIGCLNWKRKRGDFLSSEERAALDRWEKDSGAVTWTSFAEYQQQGADKVYDRKG